MTSDEALIHRLEAADAQGLASLLARATAAEERVLRRHLGDDRFRRMRDLAVRHDLARRGPRAPRGNVVVIHGIMGGELTARRGSDDDLVWLNLFRVVFGALDRLQLKADGETDVGPWTVRATGMLKRYYGELLLALAAGWNVKPFFFDWRKPLDEAADALDATVASFGDGAPVHLVAHSMGGLVARTFIANHPARWQAMWDQPGHGQRGGRLVMLGTPNQGSFAIPQVVTGVEPLVRLLETADVHHDLPALRAIFNTFPGSLQMLPSPFVYGSLEPLYQAATWAPLSLSQQQLDAARAHHAKLRPIVDGARMIYVAGYDQVTYSYVDPTLTAMSNVKAYAVTRDGDGRVPHRLGLLDGVPTYYLPIDHGALSTDERVFALLPDLLDHGRTDRAPTTLPGTRAAPAAQARLRAQREAADAADVTELSVLVAHKQARAASATASPVDAGDRRAEELIVGGFLGGRHPPSPAAVAAALAATPAAALAGAPLAATRPPAAAGRRARMPTLAVRVVLGSIAEAGVLDRSVDAIAVGQYAGVRPQGPVAELDHRLSPAGLLAGFAARGALPGGLGQPFFLPALHEHRTVVVMGLGQPGRLGVPELTLAVRELCWALGRLGKRHLATVLIGAGAGNLSLEDAAGAWMRGVRRLLAAGEPGLTTLTFVEHDPARVAALLAALQAPAAAQAALGLRVIVETPAPAVQRRWEHARQQACRRACEEPPPVQDLAPAPTVVTVGTDEAGLRISALTERAAIPERTVAVDRDLVLETNRRLAAAEDPAEQRRLGQFLLGLLVPDDLRAQFQSPAPLVLLLDADTARLHWEMLAPTSRTSGDGEGPGDVFLGTTRGLTRRLRTTFAGPPEPPPPTLRNLRVLVVSDPAEDARLPGAAREGLEVAELLRSFADGGNRIDVTHLQGPTEASRLAVLMALTENHYDVLHFAGHCVFDEDNPAESGYVFSGGARLTARELTRIDRVPPFVFSNACESGITPERAAGRVRSAAASFAEAFFARGVGNFICTAWEVDDEAARTFALQIYRELLGLGATPGQFGTMAQAMQQARLAILRPGGTATWGAYQHYGSPAYRFFESPAPAHLRERAARKRTRRRERRERTR